jgi:hypothetical protein
MTTRRGFITGLISFVATAPAIVRAGSLMPVKLYDIAWDDGTNFPVYGGFQWSPYYLAYPIDFGLVPNELIPLLKDRLERRIKAKLDVAYEITKAQFKAQFNEQLFK